MMNKTELTLYSGADTIIAEIQVDEETGEIGTDYPLEILVKRNPIGCAAYVLHTTAQADMIKSRITELQRLAKSAEKRAERVKQSLAEVMELTGVMSIQSNDGTFSAKLSIDRDKSVEIFDEKQLPQDYKREIPAKYEPDKPLIRKALEDSYDVPGARIVTKNRLTIK